MAVTKTGVPLLEVRGKIGNIVFQRFGDGLIMRERVVPEDPRTAAQLLSRALMSRVAGLWHGLSDAQYAAWAAFAPENPYRTFTGLTTKWLRLHPTGTPPLLPPTGPFYGDACTVTAGSGAVAEEEGAGHSSAMAGHGFALPEGEKAGHRSAVAEHGLALPEGGELESSSDSVRSQGDAEQLPSHPGLSASGKASVEPGKATASPLQSGLLTVTANQPNAANVVTEILVQPMANTHRKPRVRGWVTAAYLTFASGTLTQTVPLASGAYAVAYRFVLSTTGQSTERCLVARLKVGR